MTRVYPAIPTEDGAIGRAPSGQALALRAKPASGLGATRCDPSRIEVKHFDDGGYYIYHHHPTHLTKCPRFRHINFEFAEAEARRLLALYPEGQFLILHAVATVRVNQEEPE